MCPPAETCLHRGGRAGLADPTLLVPNCTEAFFLLNAVVKGEVSVNQQMQLNEESVS